MPIHVNCPVCGQRLRVSNYAAGRITKCNACGNAVRVPKPTAMLKEGEDETEDAGKHSRPDEIAVGPLTPSEAWYRSIEKLSGSLDWMAERPIRILFVALLMVAAYVGVATAKWALSKPQEGPIATQEPVDLEPWDGVGTADGNERVRVTAQSVTTEPIEVIPVNMNGARKTPNAYLKIALKIENLGSADLKYTGWANDMDKNDHAARMRDDTGQSHKQVVWRSKIVGQTSSTTIKPAGSLVDILVFDPPGTYVKYLKLSLPAVACEGTGELRIKIPRTRVLD